MNNASEHAARTGVSRNHPNMIGNDVGHLRDSAYRLTPKELRQMDIQPKGYEIKIIWTVDGRWSLSCGCDENESRRSFTGRAAGSSKLENQTNLFQY